MKSLIVLFTLAVCANAQYWPYWFPFIPAYPPYASYYPPYGPPPSYPSYPPPSYRPPSYQHPSYPPQPLPQPALLPPPPPQNNGGDEYAASLGGAPVGFYSRRQNTGPYGTNTEVSGVSLSNAKVGIFGKDRSAVHNPAWIV